MLIAQIDYLTLNARVLTCPMCFDMSRDARAALACRVSHASYVFSALVSSFRFIWISMLRVYGHDLYFNYFSAGTVFIRQNLTSTDVRFWRIKTVPALKGLMLIGQWTVIIHVIMPMIFILSLNNRGDANMTADRRKSNGGNSITLGLHNIPASTKGWINSGLTLRTLMSTTVDILHFYWHLYNQLLKVKCAFNFETLIYYMLRLKFHK